MTVKMPLQPVRTVRQGDKVFRRPRKPRRTLNSIVRGVLRTLRGRAG